MGKKILSIFVDESGDFGEYCPQTPYYLVSLVLHDQSVSVDGNIAALDAHLVNLGYPQHSVHTGPLVRRESFYKSESMLSRKRLFNAIFNFARKCPVKYLLIAVSKKECLDEIELISKLSKTLAK
ncbi:MAG: hypothetical protein AAGU77_13055, partial [Bacillota bacterium]